MIVPAYYFEFKQSGPRAKKREFWFRLVCRNNGEIMFTGERHPTKAKVKRAMLNCVTVVRSGRYEVIE